MNKKFLLLMFAGIFFILFFSGVVSSATKDVKIDWNGVPFNWCDGATGAGHNVEYCGYRVSDKVEVACDESGDYDSPSSCGGDSGCLLANAGDYSVIVYAGFWYNAKCRGQSHGAGKHYSNPTAYWDNGEKYDADYSPHHSPIQSATATCIDSDGDNYYSSVIVGSGTNGGVVALCGAEESASCDNDASNFPGNVEAPDGKDNDCDGVIDEGFSCVDGQTPQSCGTTNVGECEYGTQTCSGGQWGTCGGTYVGPSPEVYESPGLDNDCDGLVNEGVGPCTDADGDKWVAQASGQCSPLTAPAISGFKGYSDCNDVSPSGLKVYPNAPEQCDGVDNQCPQSQTSVDENPNTICSTPGQICWTGTCKTPSAYWTSDSAGINKITAEVSASAGEKYYLVLENFPQGIAKWEFEIWEEDNSPNDDDEIRTGGNKLSGTIQGNKLIAEWTVNNGDLNRAESDDSDLIYEFYFKAKGFKKLGGTWEYSGGTGTWERTEYGVAGNGIWKMDDEVDTGTWEVTGLWGVTKKWKIDGGTWGGTFEFDNEAGTWIADDGSVGGTWDTTTKEDESVYEIQSSILGAEEQQGGQQIICGDGNVDSGEECDDGNSISGDGCSAVCIDETSCTTNSDCQSNEECNSQNYCISITPLTLDCSPYTLCSDATNSAQCSDADLCGVSSLVGGCSWNVLATPPSCNQYEIQVIEGVETKCNYQETITATCDTNDFLEYSLTSLNHPEDGCEDKSPVSILCSSKTKLPLENKYGIILTIIAIIGIYSFWFFRRKNKILK